MKRLATVFGMTALAVFAFSMVPFTKLFGSAYGVKSGTKLGDAKCMVCHLSTKGGKLNAYGKDIDLVMKKQATKKMTLDHLKAVEEMDSDGDGFKNIDEIKADRLPGEK
jgi:hypothetical protein